MADPLVYVFPSNEKPTLSEVGGKGLSLVIGSREGLPVPPGFILTVAFFEPWLSQLKATEAWKHFLVAKKEKELEHACSVLKKEVTTFTCTDEQRQALSSNLEGYGHELLFAVRSSAPEEDLENTSFAGGYDTMLGVTHQTIEDALRKIFASCLDYRVAVYKRTNSLDITDPRIAIVVQKQIASDVAGVGFSLNPLTNNYDDAVITANWGLGETVVAGIATPDTFVVDKVSLRIKSCTIGTKETSIWLLPTGGTEEKSHYRSPEPGLTNAQAIELTKLIQMVENLYGKPMDIEWAYEKDQLYLLQARPITAYVPLSPELVTKPGARKRLYFDGSITAEGMTRPISHMGTSSFHHVLSVVGRIIFLRDITRNIDTTIAHAGDGRLYVNLSTFLRLLGKRRIANLLSNVDTLTMETIDMLDGDEYMPEVPTIRLLPYGLLLQAPFILFFLARAKFNVEVTHRRIEAKRREFERDARELIAQDRPLATITNDILSKMLVEVFLRHVPLVILSRAALARIEKMAKNHPAADALTRSLPHNITIEMSIALSNLADVAPADINTEEFVERLQCRDLPMQFLERWDHFIEVYGIRGPNEIDLSVPRYSDNPTLLLEMIVAAKKSGEHAQTVFDRGVREREAVFESIHSTLLTRDSRAAKRFARDYAFVLNYGGLRETHKYYLVLGVALLRKKIIAIAKEFVAAKRLDTVEQIFDLSLEEVDQARIDSSIDLRALGKRNTAFLRKLERVARPPTLIDSRGFIPRPPKHPGREGISEGTPISSGVVRGPVKILHTPDEKSFLKGEILVARATDPGWTPLFLDAAAVVLEIGGILQHGALVAREYGLPCVVGIENATTLWKDGTVVEVDGAAGTVRVVNP
ncbi:MAG TPA: PEP/pyruvate-binding domain-containing protein [Candidatus Paceibacterota bacterium]|nr:PEP/pyruvate-binding domain-containing protein [Candidatus Paceibacterota bacterium]